MKRRLGSKQQAILPLNTWGGRRRGAGRKKQKGSGVAHLRRPELSPRHPAHVTSKLIKLRSLRRGPCFRLVKRALAAGGDRPGFRVVEYSVQANHVHLICEAADRMALARGLQGLFTRIAQGINRLFARTGKVFADRYHAHILRTPREVRNALAYVLNNARRHAAQFGRRMPSRWVDPCSSAPVFFGLVDGPAVAAPKTWLLREGYRRAGPVRMDEVPIGSG